jgi:putative transcriptional regulator
MNWTHDEKRRAEAISNFTESTDTMSKSGEALLESLDDALAHASGEASGVRLQSVTTPDVRAIRRKLNMSQLAFAETYRIPLPTLKNWEQRPPPPRRPGRRLPACYLPPP